MSISNLLEKYFSIERASVFHYRDFQFNDGSSKDKFIITLNCKIFDDEVSFVLPTSQTTKSFYQDSKNLEDVVTIEKNESQFFHKRTFIDLKNIREEDFEFFEEAFKIGNLNFLGKLEDDIFERIESTIRNSELIDDYLKDIYLCKMD